MSHQFIAYKNSTIHYAVWGSGLKLLFCLHGYGEQAESFAALAGYLGEDYTIIAIDMPFHGKTQWEEGLLFTPADLYNIMQTIIAKTTGPVQSNPRFNLLGYSMGGRVALHLLQNYPSQIERLVLVAPDGLHKNIWYRLATRTLIGNWLFKYVMYMPGNTSKFLKPFEKYKLVGAGLLRVAHYYTDDEKERARLYCRWTTMRKFKPNLPRIKKTIRQHGIPIRFLFGRFDNIILSHRSNIFKQDTQNVQVHIIDAGHRLLQEKYVQAICRLFYQ